MDFLYQKFIFLNCIHFVGFMEDGKENMALHPIF